MKTYPAYLLIFLFLVVSCAKPDDSPVGQYRRAVSEGLQAELPDAAALLGIPLGITDQSYYDRCTELNRQQLITMGSTSNSADHIMENDLDRPAKLSFRPIFSAQVPRILQGIDAEFMYQDWSPWNKAAYADKLLPQVVDYLDRTLGTQLTPLEHPSYGTTYTAVDGSRLVAAWEADQTSVTVIIADLSALHSDPLGLAR